jgi:hypothetical protein
VWTTVQRADPTRLALAPAPPGAQVAVVSVTRARHADTVRQLVASCPDGWTVRLWSLDGVVVPDLRPLTAGHGPGSRLELLNRLVATIPPADRRDGLVVADDDVRFTIGDVGALVEAGRRVGYDLYQPAHVATSHHSWTFVRRRPLSFARETEFVEQGPVVVLSERAQAALLPFPEDLGMAWGIEARWWTTARRHDLRLGVVDAVGVRHLTPVAGHYDRGPLERSLAAEVRRAGLERLEDLHRVVARVGLRAAWRSRPG